MERVLKGVFYTGKFYFNGILYPASHQPLVTDDLFARVQRVLAQRSWSKPLAHLSGFPYRGYLKCAVCGCAITATRKKNHNYYFCTNKKYICDQHKKYLREEELTKVIGNVFENIAFDKDMAEKSLELYKLSLEKEIKTVEENNQKLIELIDKLKEKKNTLVDLLLNKKIDQETYNKKYEEIKSEITNIENKISSISDPKNIGAIRKYVGTVKDIGISINDMFNCGDVEVRRDLMKSLCWNLDLKDTEITSVQYKMPWKLFVNVSKSRDIDKWLAVLYAI